MSTAVTLAAPIRAASIAKASVPEHTSRTCAPVETAVSRSTLASKKVSPCGGYTPSNLRSTIMHNYRFFRRNKGTVQLAASM
jgi:hypothetical protein